MHILVELLFFDRANFQNPIDIKKLTPTIRKKGMITFKKKGTCGQFIFQDSQ